MEKTASCIVALPSASIMDSILENLSSASICLTPLFSFSFTIFQNRLAAGADAYVTADFYYHTAHDVLADDFVVIDPDHHMEAIAKDKLVELVNAWQTENNWDLDRVFASTENTDPYTYI